MKTNKTPFTEHYLPCKRAGTHDFEIEEKIIKTSKNIMVT